MIHYSDLFYLLYWQRVYLRDDIHLKDPTKIIKFSKFCKEKLVKYLFNCSFTKFNIVRKMRTLYRLTEH